MPVHSFKGGEKPTNVLQTSQADRALQNFTSNLISPLHNEIKTKSSSEGISTKNIFKIDNFSEGGGSVIKNFIERFLEHTHAGSNKNERFLSKMDLPMLRSSHENDRLVKHPTISQTNPIPLPPNNNLPPISPSNSKVQFPECHPKFEIEDDKNIFIRNSPNIFDDYNFNQNNTNIFNSPNYSGEFNLYRIPSDGNKEQDNDNHSLIGMNNFNTLAISRNNSMDINDMFKNQNIIEDDLNKKQNIQNMWMDDSIFSVSSPPKSKTHSQK
jgi:hypothetical protein